MPTSRHACLDVAMPPEADITLGLRFRTSLVIRSAYEINAHSYSHCSVSSDPWNDRAEGNLILFGGCPNAARSWVPVLVEYTSRWRKEEAYPSLPSTTGTQSTAGVEKPLLGKGKCPNRHSGRVLVRSPAVRSVKSSRGLSVLKAANSSLRFHRFVAFALRAACPSAISAPSRVAKAAKIQ
jgi:hypothetical protein